MARLVCCLVLLVCLRLTVSSIAKDFWSIDCGGNATVSSPSTTSYLRNVTWELDDAYVRGGEAREAKTNPDDYVVLQTMRVFGSKKPAKNCYTIPVGSGRKVIARAWFYYGNYDGKQEPPSFQLQFEANEWTSVETEMDDWDFEEAVYVTKSANTSICVARGETDQDPLVSAIQVAVLNTGMYREVNSSRALFWSSRVAFGANRTIGDKYGRFWSSTTRSLDLSEYTVLNNTAPKITVAVPGDPPEQVFRTAITPKAGGNITIVTPYLGSTPVPIYFILYFTDPTPPVASHSGGNRSIQINLDGSVIVKGEVPAYGVASQYSSPIVMGTNNTFVDLISMAGASSPPVLSAWELYLFSGELDNGTYSHDVNALLTLQNQFKVLRPWTGDPCLPAKYNWEWVACDSDSPPRITNLSLSGYGLPGTLPDFGSLDALVSIDLSNNSLTGAIPSFLGSMPNLRVLNLADNDFTSIPDTLKNNSRIKLIVQGNLELQCTGPACSPTSSPQPKADSPFAAAPLPQSAGTQRWSAYSNNLGFVLGMLATYMLCMLSEPYN